MSIYKALVSLPAFGTMLSIANSYAYNGDQRSKDSFAGFARYIRAFTLELLMAVALTAISVWPLVEKFAKCNKLNTQTLSEFALKPGELIVSTLPSLLGFGIGLYALMFAVSPKFISFLESSITELKKSGKKSDGSSLAINASFAYPLMILLITLAAGSIQRIYPSPKILIATWILFWYSIIVILGMIGVIFELGNHSLIEKWTKPKNPNGSTKEESDVSLNESHSNTDSPKS